MTTPQVGRTHDVVLYAIGNNVAPCGLVIDGGSYRITNAPTFVPRLAMGSPTGADYTMFASWVQNDWGGRSGANLADTHNYRMAEHMMPVLPDWRLHLTRRPFYTQPYPQDISSWVSLIPQVSTTWTTKFYALASPAGVIPPALHNIATAKKEYPVGSPPGGDTWGVPVLPTGDNKAYTETRVINGGLIYRAYIEQGAEWPASGFAVCNSISFGAGRALMAYDAVSYSTVAFISTYTHSTYTVPQVSGSVWEITRIVPGPIMAHCYNTIYQPAGTTSAGALAVYDGRLWRSHMYWGKIAYYQPEQTTSGYWSEFTTVQPGINIRRMCEFIGRLMIGATDGLYAYESGRSYKIVDLTNQISPANFSIMASIAGSLWFNIGHRVWRYTSGGLLEEIDTTFYSNEFPVSIEGGPNCVYILCAYRAGNSWHLYQIDTNTGATVVVGESPAAPKDAYTADSYYHGTFTAMPWMSLPAIATLDEFEIIDFKNVDKVGESLMVGPHVVQIELDPVFYSTKYLVDSRFYNYGLRPYELVANDKLKIYSGHVRTGFITLGYPAANKAWQRVVIDMTVPNSCWAYVTLGYRTIRPAIWREDSNNQYAAVDASTWTYLEQTQVSSGINVIEFPTPVVSRQIELKPMITVDIRKPIGPISLNSLELDALYAGPADRVRRQHSFEAVVVDNIQLINMEVENSAVWVAATLYSLADSGIPHVVAVPYPPPMGHTVKAVVEIGAAGAAVPILSYKHSIPGSHVSIVLKEV